LFVKLSYTRNKRLQAGISPAYSDAYTALDVASSSSCTPNDAFLLPIADTEPSYIAFAIKGNNLYSDAFFLYQCDSSGKLSFQGQYSQERDISTYQAKYVPWNDAYDARTQAWINEGLAPINTPTPTN